MMKIDNKWIAWSAFALVGGIEQGVAQLAHRQMLGEVATKRVGHHIVVCHLGQ